MEQERGAFKVNVGVATGKRRSWLRLRDIIPQQLREF